MTRIDISRIMISVPAVLLFISLLCLCIKPLSVFVYNCYPEIIVLALGWVVFWLFVILWKRIKDSHPINLAIMLVLVIITAVASFPYAKKYAKGRYLFYVQGLYAMSYEDVGHIESAIEAFEEKDWDSVKSHLESCSRKSRDFFSYSTSRLLSEIELIDISKQNFSIILEEYKITPLILSLYESLAHDFGGTFQDDFLNMRTMILAEIDKIDLLYDAIGRNDTDECLSLISSHGYYWFETEIIDLIINSDDCIRELQRIVVKDDDGLKFKENLIYVWGLQ